MGLLGLLALRRRPEAVLVAGRHVALVMPALLLLVAGRTVAVRATVRWCPHGPAFPAV